MKRRVPNPLRVRRRLGRIPVEKGGNKMPARVIAFLFISGCAAWAAQRTFDTPQEAAKALQQAAEHNDTAEFIALFGPSGKAIVESGDAAEDKAGRDMFAKRAQEKMLIEQDSGNPDRATIVVGQSDWPFPVPLVKVNGKWQFDTARGRVEILARRIGRNELSAVEVCRGYVAAQMEYATEDRDKDGGLEYAQKIVATAGKHDGLYGAGAPEGLVPKAFADAAAASAAGKLVPYHGYYFRILTAQGPDAEGGAVNYVVKGEMIGGFALVAWPAEYAVSGVHTLIVNHKGVIYEKDLGPGTSALARRMAAFNPDKSWRAVEKE
jgi:hypothetical protein